MKTAFLFPGQGAQVVGMGADIAKSFPKAAEIFNKANDIVGFDLSGICFEGPAEELNSTTISQPAIFTTSAAILEVIRTEPATKGIRADFAAGLLYLNFIRIRRPGRKKQTAHPGHTDTGNADTRK